MDPQDRPFSQLSRSEPPTSSPSLHAILSSPDSRLAHARTLLHLPHLQPQNEGEDTTHPLAVFLFLLDCLTYLAGEGTSGSWIEVGLGEIADESTEEGVHTVESPRGKGGQQDEGWSEWIEYVREMVSL